MGEIVYIGTVAKQRDITVEQAWDRFVEAQKISQQSLRFEDGLAARRAYREFLELYTVRK